MKRMVAERGEGEGRAGRPGGEVEDGGGVGFCGGR